VRGPSLSTNVPFTNGAIENKATGKISQSSNLSYVLTTGRISSRALERVSKVFVT
jgi:hypothetical protein